MTPGLHSCAESCGVPWSPGVPESAVSPLIFPNQNDICYGMDENKRRRKYTIVLVALISALF